MSGGGGDTGGEAGGAGKGAGGGGSSPDLGGNTGWDAASGTYSGAGAGSTAAPASGATDPLGFATSPGEQAGFQGSGGGSGSGLPSEITSGSSTGGSQWGAPSINDFVTPGTNGGFNLGGSGPVGGNSGMPGAGGGINTPMSFGTFSTDTSGASGAPSIDTSMGPPAAGGASSFAAPAGVSGTPQLDSLVASPAGGTPTISPNDQSIFDSLNGAQAGAVNEYADSRAPSVPSAEGGSTTLPATTPPASGGGGGSGNNSQMTGMIPGVSNSTLGVAAAGAGLLNNLINGRGPTPATAALQRQAGTNNATSADLLARGTSQGAEFGRPALQSGQDQTAHGQVLQQFVATGTLPQGYEDQVQQAAQAARSTIISNYANRGLPTDPTRNSALAQELAQVDARLPAAREQLASSLATTGNSIVGSGNQTSATGNALTANGLISGGVQAAGISSGIYQTLANLETGQNRDRATAIGNFAAALNGGTRGSNPGVTVNLPNRAA